MSDKGDEMPQMNAGDLWLEEMFTDRAVGVIRRLTPVKADGAPDPSRKVAFVGESSLMTPAGSLPINFEIPAENLTQAVAAYGDTLQKAVAETMEELKEMRRKASSSLVLPGAGGLPGGGLPPVPGKLKL